MVAGRFLQVSKAAGWKVTMNSSRRDFIRTAAVTAGAAGALAACGSAGVGEPDRLEDSPSGEAKGLPLTVAGLRYDRTEALADGAKASLEDESGTW